jgi:hypothetical protein
MSDTGHDFLDLNGRQVHAFASQMANLGLRQLTDLLIDMFKSGSWQRFRDGLGTYKFLPGEFDYFLTQQGVNREDVMNGVRDIETKARLEAAMDERRTGELGYRRRISEVRVSNPQRPGRPILPFGFGLSEAKVLVEHGALPKSIKRPPLGSAVRRFTNTGGRTSRSDAQERPRAEKIRRAAIRLSDSDLADLIEALKTEQRRRSHQAAAR